MKLIVILGIAACSFAAKLDRTYLPPPGAEIAGGSPGSLTAPHGVQPGQGPFGQTSSQGPSAPAFGRQNASQGPSASSQGSVGSPFGSQGPANTGLGGQRNQGPSAFGSQSPSSAGFGSQPTQGHSSFASQGPSTTAFGSQRTQGPSSFGPDGQSGNDQQNFDQHTGPSNQDFATGPVGRNAYSQPERPQAAVDRAAEILRYENENDGEKFAYSFETSNGIAAEENGVATNGVQAQGAFSYTGDDGLQYSVTYTADENGYQPHGDHLPTPPPIPEAILKSIEENARAAAAGTQEGAYQEDYDQNNAPGSPQQYNQGTQNYNAQGQSSRPSKDYGAPNAQDSFGATNQDGQASSSFQQNSFRPQFQAPSSSSNQYNAQTSSKQYNAPSNSQVNAPTSSFNQQNTPSSQSQYNGPSSSFNQQNTPSSQSQYNGPSSSFNQQNSPSSKSQYNAPASSFNQQNIPTSKKYNAPVDQKDAGSHVAAQQRPTQQFVAQTGYQYNRPSTPQGSDSQPSQTTGFGSRAPQQNSQRFQTQEHASPSGQLSESSSVPQSKYNAPSSSQQSSFGRTPVGPSQQQQSSRPGFNSSPASTAQQSFERPSTGARPQYNAPNAIQQTTRPGSQQAPSGRPSFTGENPQSGSQMPENYPGSPYQYNDPKSDSTPKGFAPQGSNAARNEQFGGPRQPPSYSPEEGYKY